MLPNELINVKLPYSIGVLTNVENININSANLSFIPSAFQNRVNSENQLLNLNLRFNVLTTQSFQDGDKNQYINENFDETITELNLSTFNVVDLSFNDFEIEILIFFTLDWSSENVFKSKSISLEKS